MRQHDGDDEAGDDGNEVQDNGGDDEADDGCNDKGQGGDNEGNDGNSGNAGNEAGTGTGSSSSTGVWFERIYFLMCAKELKTELSRWGSELVSSWEGWAYVCDILRSGRVGE